MPTTATPSGSRDAGSWLEAYLFWGSEYWLLRQQAGDESYMGAFKRIVMSGDKLSAYSTGDD